MTQVKQKCVCISVNKAVKNK